MPLVLVTPADDYQLLTAAELRLAAGLESDDTSQDASLETLGLEAAEWVASLCGVPAADGSTSSPYIDSVPTFRQEVVQETRQIIGMPRTITLARRFISSVSVTLNDIAIDSSDYRVNAQAGTLERLVAGLYPAYWGSGTLVATYTAGFVTVPPAIKAATRDYVAMLYSQASRDYAIRSETINDIESVTYRVGSEVEASIEAIARQRLARYITDNYG